MSTIIVVATSLRVSGGLTILKQFITNIPDNDDSYIIFVDPEFEKISKKNVIYLEKSTRTQKERLKFDLYDFKKELKRRNLSPDIIISLQNNALNYSSNIPQLVYYHIPLPLFPKNWNPFKKEERRLFLYKKLYPYIIRSLDGKHVHYSAQIPSIKEGMIDVLGIDSNRIDIFTPDIPKVKETTINYGKSNIFLYPATPLIYKNHEIIIRALDLLIKRRPELKCSIKIIFTISEYDCPRITKLVEDLNLKDIIVMKGPMPYNDLLDLYRKATALLFPSYIETFGLPLLEAAGYGLPVIASDIPYVHDVIGDYEGVRFVDPFNAEKWADKIEKAINLKIRYSSFSYKLSNGWNEFFNLINTLKSNTL